MSEYSFDLCVIGGAGHVGLPFALVFADRGLNVVVYDINRKAVDVLVQGVVPFMEEGAEELLKKGLATGKLTFSDDRAVIGQSRVVVVTIGTPVDEFLNPIFSGIRSSFEEFLPYLHPRQLLILRSTLYPGTSEWLDAWLIRQGKKMNIAFCPERLVQGKGISEISSLPQIISGNSPEAEQAAATLFQTIDVEIVPLSLKEAEFAKLFSNTYRYISFAIANQFYMLAADANVDYERIMKAAKHHYPRLDGLTGAGFTAGPCLFKDAMQLNAFSNNNFFLGLAAMNVNEGLVLFVADRISAKYDLSNRTVGLLGMSFKPDNDDIRSSLSYKMKKVMTFRAKEVLTTDPYVTTDPGLSPLEDVLEKSDLLILCVPHSQYRRIPVTGKPVIDIWGFLGRGTLV